MNWRLPTKGDLTKMYQNLHKNGIGDFSNTVYWSTSFFATRFYWCQDFTTGSQQDNSKYCNWRVRAVRTFEIDASSNYYKIGEVFHDGIVFDIQGNTVFICKKQDEAGNYTWDEAVNLFNNASI